MRFIFFILSRWLCYLIPNFTQSSLVKSLSLSYFLDFIVDFDLNFFFFVLNFLVFGWVREKSCCLESEKMGLISGILMGMILGIGLMAGWRHMMRRRSTKRIAKVRTKYSFWVFYFLGCIFKFEFMSIVVLLLFWSIRNGRSRMFCAISGNFSSKSKKLYLHEEIFGFHALF